MSGTNLHCDKCGSEYTAMLGSPPICRGEVSRLSDKRWTCPMHEPWQKYGIADFKDHAHYHGDREPPE